METEQGSPAQCPGVPQTPLLARGRVGECSSVWSGGGLLPLLVAPGQALVLSWPLPGPSELSKLNYGVSQRREVTGCWVCGAEAGGRQEP